MNFRTTPTGRLLACWSLFVLAVFAPLTSRVAAEERNDSPPDPQVIEKLAKELGSSNLKTKRDAAYALARLGTGARPALATLIKTLDSERDSQVWVQVASAIARIGPDAKDAIEALVDNLGSRDEQRRYRAAYALGRIGKAAIPKLKKSLKSRSSRERASAALAFTWMGPIAGDASAELIELLSDSDEHVRVNVADALENVGKPAEAHLVSAIEAEADRSAPAIHVLGRIGLLDDTTIAAIGQAIQSEDANVRAAAIGATFATNTSSITPADLLRRTLTDTSENVRNVGLLELRRQRQAAIQFRPLLEELLNSDQTAVVRTAATGLGVLGPSAEASVPRLIDKLQQQSDDDPTFIRAIARIGVAAVPYLLKVEETTDSNGPIEKALAEIGPTATPALVHAMEDTSDQVRLRAIRSLGRMDGLSSDTFESIVNRLEDSDSAIRTAAAESIGLADKLLNRSNEAFVALSKVTNDKNPRVRRSAMIAMSNAADKGVRQAILAKAVKQALTDQDTEVRTGGLTAITRCPEIAGRFVNEMIQCLKHDRVEVRLNAASALAKLSRDQLKKSDAIDSLATALVETLSDSPDDIRVQAAVAVGKTKAINDETIVALGKLMNHSNPQIVRSAITALAELGSESQSAFASLLKLDAHPDAEVRAVVADALPKIAEDKSHVVEPLLKLLKDADWIVRREAAHSLGDLGEAAAPAVPFLFKLLEVEDDTDFARGALKKIDAADANAVPVLIEGLKSGDRRRTYYAVFLLTKVGPDAKDALPELAKVRKEGDSRLRGMIDRAVKAIGTPER